MGRNGNYADLPPLGELHEWWGNTSGEYTFYALVDPLDGRARYIGKTKNPENRAVHHGAVNGLPLKAEWTKRLRRYGLRPQFVVLSCEYMDSVSDANVREKEWVAHYIERGAHLLNGEANTGAMRALGRPCPHCDGSGLRRD